MWAERNERGIEGDPPCNDCRVEPMPENADAHRVFNIVRFQLILGPGSAFDIRHDAIWRMIDELKIKKTETETKGLADGFKKRFTDYRKEIDELRHQMHLLKMKLAADSREKKQVALPQNAESYVPHPARSIHTSAAYFTNPPKPLELTKVHAPFLVFRARSLRPTLRPAPALRGGLWPTPSRPRALRTGG